MRNAADARARLSPPGTQRNVYCSHVLLSYTSSFSIHVVAFKAFTAGEISSKHLVVLSPAFLFSFPTFVAVFVFFHTCVAWPTGADI